MEKVQIGRVVEFYSNSCLVEIKEFKIPCKTPKGQDIVVGDFVEIVPLHGEELFQRNHQRQYLDL